ncbi:choice-of-anchor M domain-containing protein [Phytohabitans sp. ZYX-F-186]|uniref:Choice-of-anchor M domain-containing protein n=1 Tax=Phytohabitans maris TaxID=3071409 RepID=A0ABU0ZSF3_9ACTN|nr:choice-of-anchor M domain-containing protein [Phytohabitans sp. ZYX-F-186]MDQ7909959.1 choice-of-anchor M domain-containing protein [Phytohabitans sp. ZYX-F-186]
MRTPLRLLVASGALVGALVATAAPAQASGQVVIDEGHVDVIGVAYEDGELNLHIHDESVEPGVEREPGEVKFQVKPEAETTVPANPAYSFLGNAGDPVWILPQVQNPDLVWAGFGTEEIELGVFQNDQVKVTFWVAAGPGDLAIYTENSFGLPSSILVDTGDGLPDTVTLSAGDHTHANWAFDAPGHYWLVVTATGKLAGSGQTVVDAGLYHFQVLS